MTSGAVTGRRRLFAGRRSSGAGIRSSIGGEVELAGVGGSANDGGNGLVMSLHLWLWRWCFLRNLLWHLKGETEKRV